MNFGQTKPSHLDIEAGDVLQLYLRSSRVERVEKLGILFDNGDRLDWQDIKHLFSRGMVVFRNGKQVRN